MLKGEVAIVTGSSQGIGKAIATYFSTQGASVVINYPFSREEEKAQAIVKKLKKQGGKAIAIQADVTKEKEVRYLIEETVKHFNQLSILVNNAGITKDRTVKNMTVDDFNDVIETNLTGTFIASKIAVEQMEKNKYGRIINISSIAGQTGNFGQSNYAASKAGVIGLTKTFALEYAKKGITVNAVAPGFIKTDMTDAIPENIREKLLKTIPVSRPGEPEEIASTVAFLASKKAGFITGQEIAVNGGMYM